MAHVLHLWKADASPLALAVVLAAAADPGERHTLVLLDGSPAPAVPAHVAVRRLAPGDLDAGGLLELVFEADRTVAW